MHMKPLGANGPEVSLLGLGTVKFGRDTGVKYPDAFSIPNDRQVVELLALAHDLGINLLDTAPAYGASEARLGALLNQRQEWIIVNKAGEDFIDGKSRFNYSAAAITASIERSLRRLKTDYLDVVLLHCSDNDMETLTRSDALEALTAARDAGKIRAMGASTKTIAAGLLAVETCDVVMLTLNARDQSQLPVIEAAAKSGRGVLIKKPLDSGYGAGNNGLSPLRQIIDTPGVTAAIVGTIDPNHLRDNCRAVI